MFCNQCGTELTPGAAFCLKCGNPVATIEAGPAATQQAQAQAQVHTVTFIRAKQWYAINPAVKILVDEKDEYRIDNGQTIRVAMTPGTHNVIFKCGIRNKVIDLTVQQDLTLNLKWNRVTGSLTVK